MSFFSPALVYGRDREFHPLSEYLPRMIDEEFEMLVTDIQKKGLADPITLFEDKILDGRHRYWACARAGVIPRYDNFAGTYLEAIQFVVSKNLRRRELSSSQRAMIIANLKQINKRPGFDTQVIMGDWAKNYRGAGDDEMYKTVDELIAKASFTNYRYVRLAERILQECPEAAADVLDGKRSIESVDVPRKRRRRSDAGIPKGTRIRNTQRLIQKGRRAQTAHQDQDRPRFSDSEQGGGVSTVESFTRHTPGPTESSTRPGTAILQMIGDRFGEFHPALDGDEPTYTLLRTNPFGCESGELAEQIAGTMQFRNWVDSYASRISH